jgi:hypothetical protein
MLGYQYMLPGEPVNNTAEGNWILWADEAN